MFACGGIYPFGATSFLTEDLSYQYIDFFTWCKRVLSGEVSIFYTTTMSLGQNTWGIYSYYLASPFNLLLLAFDFDHLTLAIFVIEALKIACANVAAVWYLKKRFDLQPATAICVALGYTFSLWAMTNFRNPVWLDTLILLPLMMQGAHLLASGKSSKLLLISTLLQLIICWYMAYMTILFITMFTTLEWAVSKRQIVLSRLAFRFAKTMILVLLLGAWTFLPTIFVQLASTTSPCYYAFFIPETIKNCIKGMLPLGYVLDDTPQFYCGLFLYVTFIAFFIKCKGMRVPALVVIVLILAGILIEPIQEIWCGFRSPNGYYSRVAIFVAPMMIWLAGNALQNAKIKPIVATILIVLISGDLLINAHHVVGQLYNSSQQEQDSYMQTSRAEATSLKAEEGDAFRIEKAVKRVNGPTLNEGLSTNINMLTSYCSSNDKSAIDFLKALGYGDPKRMWIDYDSGQHESDDYLGLKYVDGQLRENAKALGYLVPKAAEGAMLPVPDATLVFKDAVPVQHWTKGDVSYIETNQKALAETLGDASTAMKFDEFDSWKISGTIEVSTQEAENSLLMISVPNAKGWTVKVNDEVVQTSGAYNNALMLIPVSAGTNQIEMTFISPGFIPGCIISAITLIALAIAAAITRIKKPQHTR